MGIYGEPPVPYRLSVAVPSTGCYAAGTSSPSVTGASGPSRRQLLVHRQRRSMSACASSSSSSARSGSWRRGARSASRRARTRAAAVTASTVQVKGWADARVVPVERPVAALDRLLLMGQAVRHVVAVLDAVAVRDDQRRAGEGLGLLERLHRLHVLGSHGHLSDVHVAVGHGDQAEVLLRARLATRGELRHRAARRRLRRLPAGVGVDLGVEHEHVDVSPGREHVVEAAEADVVGPAVAADDPDALADEVVGEAEQLVRLGLAEQLEPAPSARPRALADRRSPPRRPAPQSRISRARSSPTEPASPSSKTLARSSWWSSASRMPSPNSALSSKSEFDQAGPRPMQSVVHGVVGRFPP